MRIKLHQLKDGSVLYIYKIERTEHEDIAKLIKKRSSFNLHSGHLILTDKIIAFGSINELYHKWSVKYRDFFINLLEVNPKQIPSSDMGWVNTKSLKSDCYPNISDSENVIMRSQKPYPLSLIYNCIESISPNHVMDWEYIIIYKIEKDGN